MDKFEHVDVLASLEAIMHQNTAHYQSDFEIDKDIIRRSAASQDPEDKNLLWMSRPAGTYCFRERDVFLQGTYATNTWRFYGEQTRDKVLAYAVELTGTKGDTVRGNLYELDYQEYFAHVLKEALPIAYARLTFADGHDRDFYYDEYKAKRSRIEYDHGSIKSAAFSPRSDGELQGVLEREHREREKLPSGNIKDHIRQLSDQKVLAEAQRLLAELQKSPEPNSPNQIHFMAQISQEFLLLADSREQERLSNMLPYKSMFFSGLKDQQGLFALISKNENRSKPLRQKKPSVKKQLKAAPSASRPHKKQEMDR